MDTDQITALAEDRGAGGKLRKPPPRRPPASPYARPAPRRWISKLVDPAYRVIADGATRFFPSFFSTTAPAAASALPDPTSASREQVCKLQTGEQGHKENTLKSDLQLLASESTEMASTSDTSHTLKGSSVYIVPRQDEKGEQSEKNRLLVVEQLVKKKKFSRDEFNHLVEVLNSRVVDPASDEHGKENSNLTTKKDDGRLALANMLPKVSNEQRHQESNGAIRVQDDIGASPIEIARAYMDSRASESGPNSKSMFDTVKSTVWHCDEAAMRPHDLSPSKKSSTCWPGAVVQDAYLTPQSQRNRHGLHNHPRTPYSRSLWTNSKSKSAYAQVQDSHFSSTLLHQSQATPYLQDKSKVDALGSGYGSVGPIRSSRRKFRVQSTSGRPVYSSLSTPLQREVSGVIEGFTPVKKSTDPDGTGNTLKPLSFEGGVPLVHTHTSLMAKKILEHIDRSNPTPKEKSAELKLATKWKNPESSVNFRTIFSNEDNGLVKSKDASPYKYDGPDGNKYTLNSNVDIQPWGRSDKSIDTRKEGTLASDMNVGSNIHRHGNDARTGDSQTSSMKASKEDALITLPSVVNEEKMPLASSAASRPVLPPIAVKKPESRWTFASDNGSGFTFPVSASSSVFFEPPTPSIMPLFSAGDQHQSKEGPTALSYSFGSKKSGPAVVFSFPSTSNTVHNGTGDIKFDFGSTEKARLSFSFGKNAVCC